MEKALEGTCRIDPELHCNVRQFYDNLDKYALHKSLDTGQNKHTLLLTIIIKLTPDFIGNSEKLKISDMEGLNDLTNTAYFSSQTWNKTHL